MEDFQERIMVNDSTYEMAMKYSRMMDKVVYQKLMELPEKLLQIGEGDVANQVFVSLNPRKPNYISNTRRILEENGFEMDLKYPDFQLNPDGELGYKAVINTDDVKVRLRKILVEY